MKYLCLIYVDERQRDALCALERWADAAREASRPQSGAACLLAHALEPTPTAITVRNRNGAVLVTDGPVGATAEQLGGLLLIDARNLDHAIAVATAVPAARDGCVELRPVVDRTAPVRSGCPACGTRSKPARAERLLDSD